jgi:UDP-glucose 4-epimerase
MVSTNLGTYYIVDYCSKENIKLVYGASSTKFSVGCKNDSPYAWMKARNVELIKNYANWFGLRYSIAYFFNAYGPRQAVGGSEWATVLSIFEEQKRMGVPLTLVAPGTQRRDFTHVKDIVNGLLLMADEDVNDEYQLGTGRNYSLIELADMFKSEYTMIPKRRGDRNEGVAECKYTMEKLNWKAERKLEDWISNIIKETDGDSTK